MPITAETARLKRPLSASMGVARALLLLASVRVRLCAAMRLGCTVGIDLGTTNSAIAVLREGKPLMVPNRHGETTTPSVVAYTADGVLVGQDALDQAAANPMNTIIGAKRFIGKQLSGVRVDAARCEMARAATHMPQAEPEPEPEPGPQTEP